MTEPARHGIAHRKRPIGIFDSGLGGLTIVKGLRKHLPTESIVYFGDTARLPYGTKSKSQIQSFSTENTVLLLKRRVKAVIVACNSSSSAAYPFLSRNFHLPIIDVISPAVTKALASSRNRRFGVVSTQATHESKAYERKLKRGKKSARVFSVACPLFVPLVEEGLLSGEIPRKVIASYLKPLKQKRIDTLILGCTHYPVLKRLIQSYMGSRVLLVDSVEATAQQTAEILERQGALNPSHHKGRLQVLLSDKPRNFGRLGERFLNEKISRIEVVRNL